jgi:hypothetical protein
MLFSDEPPSTDNGIESFGTPWTRKDPFGTETRCEYVPDTPRGNGYKTQDSELTYIVDKPYRQRGTNDLLGFVTITEKTTVEVTSEPMSAADRLAAKRIREGVNSISGLEAGESSSKSRTASVGDRDRDGTSSTRQLWSGSNSSNGDDLGASASGRVLTPRSPDYDLESLEFRTKPAGF